MIMSRVIIDRVSFCVITSALLFSLLGCMGTKMGYSEDLVVVEQTDTVRGNTEDNGHEWAAFTIDVPVNGPKVLVDSVMALINKELYRRYDFLTALYFIEKDNRFPFYQRLPDKYRKPAQKVLGVGGLLEKLQGGLVFQKVDFHKRSPCFL